MLVTRTMSFKKRLDRLFESTVFGKVVQNTHEVKRNSLKLTNSSHLTGGAKFASQSSLSRFIVTSQLDTETQRVVNEFLTSAKRDGPFHSREKSLSHSGVIEPDGFEHAFEIVVFVSIQS